MCQRLERVAAMNDPMHGPWAQSEGLRSPLGRIPCHVEDAVRRRTVRKAANGAELGSARDTAPAQLVTGWCVAPRILAPVRSSGRELPFFLRRQTPTCLLAEPRGTIPRHTDLRFRRFFAVVTPVETIR